MDTVPEPLPAYRHQQRALPLTMALAVGAAAMSVCLVRDVGRRGGRALSYLPALAGLAGGACLLSSLTVEVDGHEVSAAFAGGLLRRSVPVSSIESAEVVRVPWYYGWGARLTLTGWLYRVWGSEAVELRLDSGRTLTIGTDQPYLLRSAVLSALASAGAERS